MKRLLSILKGFLYRSALIVLVGLVMVLFTKLHIWSYDFSTWNDFTPISYFIFLGALLQTILNEFVPDIQKRREEVQKQKVKAKENEKKAQKGDGLDIR